MEKCLALVAISFFIGQSSSLSQNQPIQEQYQGGAADNEAVARHVNNELKNFVRQQNAQQNYIKEFKQDKIVKQNFVWPANLKPLVKDGVQHDRNDELGNNLNFKANDNSVAKNPQVVNPVQPAEVNNVINARIKNEAHVHPETNQRQRNEWVAVNQVHDQQGLQNKVAPPDLGQGNQDINRAAVYHKQQVNEGNVKYEGQGQLNQVQGQQPLQPGQGIASDDRQKSAGLEQRVVQHLNNNNVNNVANNNLVNEGVVHNVYNNNVNNAGVVNNLDNNRGVVRNVDNNNPIYGGVVHNADNNINNVVHKVQSNNYVVNNVDRQNMNNVNNDVNNDVNNVNNAAPTTPLPVRNVRYYDGNVPQNVPPQNEYRGGGQDNQQQDLGGMRLTWDWSDFAITFDDFGGAEMKVRRAPHSTTGEPWPLPQYYVKKEKRIHKLDKDLFTFKVVGETCDIIKEAVERYRIRVLEDAVEDMYDNLQNVPGTNVDDPRLKYTTDIYTKAHTIAKVDIKIRKPCEKYPSVDSDESYDLVVKKSRAFIWANEVWGALRGLETFSHIVWRGLDGEDPEDRGKNANLFVRETVISDYPRFPHRGVLLDSSRHFFFKETIYDVLDGMEQNKMNVLHWHIVDDQSFPYQSEVFPELSKKGAYHPSFVYTQRDIGEIIDYARFRGIRVMPEFDTPGHTYSWGMSRPELLTQCYQGSTPVKGYLGPIDPTKNSTYRFLKTLFTEVLETFKDQYIHLGGDEVPLGCWQSNPDLISFGTNLSKQQQHGNGDQTSNNNNNNYNYFDGQFDVRKVYEYYENRLMKDLREIGKNRKGGVKFVMWQEVMNNDLQLPNDTIIEVWMGDMADVNRAISMGYQVLYSTCWYLDHVDYGTKWPKYYQCDPADSTFGYVIDEKKVLGGEACLWSEYITNENMMTTLWPRASAVAERLWSAKDVRDLDSAGARLSEHRCRMLNRGLSIAQISGPDYCLKRGIGRSRDKYRTNSTCTSGRCVKSRDGTFVEMENIDIPHPVNKARIPPCKSTSSSAGILTVIGSVLIVLLAVSIGIKTTSGRVGSSRICKNRTILYMFMCGLVLYFLFYTSMWVQVFDFSKASRKADNLPLVKH